MPNFDFYVTGDKAVLPLNEEHLTLGTTLNIHNDGLNPAKQIFVILPEPTSSSFLVHFYSSFELKEGNALDLVIALKADTHIHNGIFRGFNLVGIIDHKISRQTDSSVEFLDEHNNVKLIIDNFRTKNGIILCSQVGLLNSGKVIDRLGIKLHNNNPQFTLIGDTKNDFFIQELEIRSPINDLLMDKVIINKPFKPSKIKNLTIKNVFGAEDWQLENTQVIKELSLKTLGKSNQFFADKIEISKTLAPSGKFYIAAKSYIHFKPQEYEALRGIDLVLDMSDSTSTQKIIDFPGSHSFNFDQITIIKAYVVSMTFGGSCKKLMFIDCVKVIANNLVVADLRYDLSNKKGFFDCSGQIFNNLLITGNVQIFLGKIEADNIEASGLCSVSFFGATKCRSFKLNLNLDASNTNNDIESLQAIMTIGDTGNYVVEINEIFAKLSSFHVKGQAKLGTVLIQTIDKLLTLLWVDLAGGSKLKLDRLFVGFDHDIIVARDGTISVLKTSRMLSGGQIYASVSATSKDYFFVKAGKGIRFDGSVHVIEGDIGFFSKYGDLFIKGSLKAKDNLVLVAEQGSIYTIGAKLEAKSISVYSNTGSYLLETIMKAREIVLYSLSHLICGAESKLEACKIVIVARGDVRINNSSITSRQLEIKSDNDIVIQDSEVITYGIFVQSIHDFILAHSGINLIQYSHALFASSESSDNSLIQGGLKLPCDVTLVGIFSHNKDNPLPKLQWQQTDFGGDVTIEAGKAYIDTKNGYIIGSTISARDSVIIKTSHSLEIVPLMLYNEVMSHGGLNGTSIKEVASRINAGIIDIDAGKAATFVGAICRAAVGSVKSDILHVLASPEEINTQQTRVRELSAWSGNIPIFTNKIKVGKYFDFSSSTSIAQRVGNLGIYDNYVSKDLAFTQTSGDIILDKSLTKYENLYLNAENGKMLIISRGLQDIYKGNGGGEYGRNKAYEGRIIIGGDNVYLIADQLMVQGAKFQVKGDLKIVTKEGVHILPIAVHERLMYHEGSKATVTEYIVRQVISEINAGYLDIKVGGAFEAVSALIQATGINLDVKELKLRSEYDIFERHVHFVGEEKWYGGCQEWEDFTRDSLVLPTIISTNNLFAKVSGDTTIEAAQILVKEESVIRTLGNINLLPKYDIHVHDHVSSKSYLFKFHGGKLTIAGTKTVREHFYGEEVVPTIYYTGGSFYGYSGGSIHLLGAKIIGKDIYLLGQKGVKLEAAPYHKERLVSISETGMRIGYTAGSGEVSVGTDLFKDTSNLERSQRLYESAEIIAHNKLVIASTDGNLEVISSKMKFAKAEINVRGMHFHTHQEIHQEEQTTTSMSIGIKAGIQESLSQAINRAGYLLNKTGTHWLDILDRGLNLYALNNDTQQILGDINKLSTSTNPAEFVSNLKNLNMVKFGVWASGKITQNTSTSQHFISIDNEIIGGDIDIQVDGKAIIEGIICRVDNFKIRAKDLEIKTSSNTTTTETSSCAIELTIPIAGNVGPSFSMNLSESSSLNRSYHDNNMIIVKGQLEINVDETLRVSGVKLQASEVKISAKNLVLESLQDVIEQRMKSLELSISAIGSSKSFGVKPTDSTRDASWTNAIGSIIGTQMVHIVVEQTLEIAGGLIANAEINQDGKLTDKGKLYVEAGSIIARQLHDYDDGQSFGLGITLAQKTDKKGNIGYGVGMPVTCSFNQSSRDIMPVIGKGDIVLTGKDSSLPKDLFRELNIHIGSTSSEKASLKANIPVSDIVEFIQTRLTGLAVGVAAGDDLNDSKEEDEEAKQREEKLDYYNQKIDEILENHSTLPSDIPEEDREIIARIASETKDQYPDFERSEQERIIAQSYYLYKECEKHPERKPEMQLAMAGAVLPMIQPISWLISAIVGGGVATKILLDKEDQEQYHKLNQAQLDFERSKHDNKHKQKPQLQKNRGTTSFMPDPDDFEPDDDEEKDLAQNAKKFKLDKNSPTDRKILENLDTSAEEFILKNRKATILREFPGEYLNKPIKEVIEKAARGDNIARKAKKLLIDGRFSK